MENQNYLKQTNHYECRKCGELSPLSATICPKCHAQLVLHGRVVKGVSPQEETKHVHTPVREERPETPLRERPAPAAREERPETPPRERPAPTVREAAPPPRPVVKERAPAKPSASSPLSSLFRSASGTYHKELKRVLFVLHTYLLLLSFAIVAYDAFVSVVMQSFAHMGAYVLMIFPAAFYVVMLFVLSGGDLVKHGALTLLFGLVSIGVLLIIVVSGGGVVSIFPVAMVMWLVTMWGAAVSFIGAKNKQTAEDRPFMSRTKLVIWADVLAFLTALAVMI